MHFQIVRVPLRNWPAWHAFIVAVPDVGRLAALPTPELIKQIFDWKSERTGQRGHSSC
ncbi:hypothetical protein ACFV2N_45770 [Streptomyces sp. NPDC059680]|uniref:hypothetical protein n=1 Tax=Streptomyces sp. NPDC059680 TaxID=3346904 RepID=UPI00368E11E0